MDLKFFFGFGVRIAPGSSIWYYWQDVSNNFNHLALWLKLPIVHQTSIKNCSVSFFDGISLTFSSLLIWQRTYRGLFMNWRLMTFRCCSNFWYFSIVQDAFNFCLYTSSLYSNVGSSLFLNCFWDIFFKRFSFLK